MNSNAQIPAGFTAVDQQDLSAIEGGNLIDAIENAIVKGVQSCIRWLNFF